MEENIKKDDIVEEVEAKPVSPDGDTHSALMAFIFSIVGAVFYWTVILGIVFSSISLGYSNKCDESGLVTKNPYKVFRRIAKPLAIVALCVSIYMIFAYIAAAIWGAALGTMITKLIQEITEALKSTE